MVDPKKVIVLATVLVIIETVVLLVLAFISFNPRYVWAVLVLMALTLTLFIVPAFPLNTVFIPDISSFRIRGPFFDRTIGYSEIASLRYRSVDMGMQIIGLYKGRGSLGGNFRNKEFGSFSIAGTERGPGTRYIVMKLTDGKTVVFNLKAEEDTILAFEQIKRYASMHGTPDAEPYESIARNPETEVLYGKAKKVSRDAMVSSLVLGIFIPSIIVVFYKGNLASSMLIPAVIAAVVPAVILIAYFRWFKGTGLPKTDRISTVTVLGTQLGIVPVLFAVAGLLMVPAVINLEVSDDYFSVSGMMLDEKIYYDEIIELDVTEEKFRRDWGYGGSHIGTGKFSNPNFGKVMYAAYSDVPIKIVVKHEHGIFVFNQSTEEATLEMLEFLKVKAGL